MSGQTLIRLGVRYKKFTLGFVECGLSIQQQKYIEWIAQQCNRYNIVPVVIDLSNQFIEDLRQTVLEYLEQNFPQALNNLAIFITGLEASILLDTNEEQPAILQIMNIARENYPEAIPYPFIICLSKRMLQKVQNVTPDFWSWRNAEPERYPIDFLELEIEKALAQGQIENWNDAVKQVSLLECLLEILEESDEYIDEKVEFLSNLGDAYKFLEQYSKSSRCYEKALPIIHEPEKKAILINKLGIVMRGLNDLDQAFKFFQEYYKFAVEHGDLINQGVALNNIGLILIDKGEFKDAREWLERALEVNKRHKNSVAESDTLGNLGLVCQYQDEIDPAIEFHHYALSISQRLHHQGRYLTDLMNLGAAYFKKGWLLVAISYYLMAKRISFEIGDKIKKKEALIKLGQCASKTDIKRIQSNYETEEIAALQRLFTNDKIYSGSINGVLTRQTLEAFKKIDLENRTLTIEGILDPVRYYKQAFQIAQNIKNVQSEYLILNSLAETYRQRGEIDQAISYYEDASKIASTVHDIQKEVSCLVNLIQLHGRDEPDIVAQYKKRATLMLKNAGVLKTAILAAYLKDQENQFPKIVEKNNRYMLYITILPTPEVLFLEFFKEFLINGKEGGEFFFSTHRTEFVYNLAESKNFLMDKVEGVPKLTESLQRIAQGNLRHSSKINLLRSISLHIDNLVKFFSYFGKLFIQRRSTKVSNFAEISSQGEKVDSQKSEVKEVIEPHYTDSQKLKLSHGQLVNSFIDKQTIAIIVNIEGIGFTCEKYSDTLKTSWNQSSSPLVFPVVPIGLGECKIYIKCEANGIPYDIIFSVNVEEQSEKSKIRQFEQSIAKDIFQEFQAIMTSTQGGTIKGAQHLEDVRKRMQNLNSKILAAREQIISSDILEALEQLNRVVQTNLQQLDAIEIGVKESEMVNRLGEEFNTIMESTSKGIQTSSQLNEVYIRFITLKKEIELVKAKITNQDWKNSLKQLDSIVQEKLLQFDSIKTVLEDRKIVEPHITKFNNMMQRITSGGGITSQSQLYTVRQKFRDLKQKVDADKRKLASKDAQKTIDDLIAAINNILNQLDRYS